MPWHEAIKWIWEREWSDTIVGAIPQILQQPQGTGDQSADTNIELGGIQVDRNKYPTLQ